MINKFVKIAGYLMAIMLLIFILFVHVPNSINGGSLEIRQLALISILKDLAIVGFAMHIAASAHHQKLPIEESD